VSPGIETGPFGSLDFCFVAHSPMSREKVIGPCHICGIEGELSFEHVPPRSAFNSRPVRVARGRQLFSTPNIDELRTERQNRGAGDYTLCERCNNNTGSWYGAAYSDWARQGMELLSRARGDPTLIYPYRILPLRVIKQVVCMFFSINAPDFRTRIPYLEEFVLARERKYLPDDIRIYAAYTTSPHTRSAGASGILYEAGGFTHGVIVSEIGCPPFIYVMTLDSESPDRRLGDISWFAHSGYAESRSIDVRLPVLPINTPYPTDYRTRDEIQKAAAMSAANAGRPDHERER